MSKGMTLPISSIVLIIVAVVIMAAVAMLFYTGFSKPQSSIGQHQFISDCNQICAKVNSGGPSTLDEARRVLALEGWCEKHRVSGRGEVSCAEMKGGCYVETIEKNVLPTQAKCTSYTS